MNSKQRGRLGEFWRQAERPIPRTAVLTNSQLDRFVLTAIGWLISAAPKAFPADAWADALVYLGSGKTVYEMSGAAGAIHAELAARNRRTA